MGSVDTLEQKTVTVCHGTDFVNVNFVNFCCTRRDIAQVSLLAVVSPGPLVICG